MAGWMDNGCRWTNQPIDRDPATDASHQPNELFLHNFLVLIFLSSHATNSSLNMLLSTGPELRSNNQRHADTSTECTGLV
jgi:hypothetical protein